MSTVTMQELELEHAELLPRRETMFVIKQVAVANAYQVAGNGNGNHDGGGFFSGIGNGNANGDGDVNIALALNVL
jgi:hypothetical protein